MSNSDAINRIEAEWLQQPITAVVWDTIPKRPRLFVGVKFRHGFWNVFGFPEEYSEKQVRNHCVRRGMLLVIIPAEDEPLTPAPEVR